LIIVGMRQRARRQWIRETLWLFRSSCLWIVVLSLLAVVSH